MGVCSICGQPAGFFRNSHAECVSARSTALARLPMVFSNYITNQSDRSQPAALKDAIESAARLGRLNETEKAEHISAGFHHAIQIVMADRMLTDTEEAKLNEI